ncbi:hypothetical protein GCM10010176_096100 [Nonomuraea spiralis]|nr:hypothetical protein GCM10010176_096100 [Nonomuraea spiralis]
MQKYIDLLESQLGYSEKAGAYTKFGDWYGKTVEFDADYSAAPWCDMYLSWAAHKLGYQEWIGQFAWTVRHAEWFKAQGAWGKTPKPGAFVFYDWSGSGEIDGIDHVGIVTAVRGDKILTIEGNIDGGVAKRKERDTGKVVGYGYPERIKARLEEEAAQKRADEQAAMPARPGTDVGTLQLPEDSLSSLIPHVEQERPASAPLAARPKHTAERPAKATATSPSGSPAVPSPAASPETAPVPTAAAGRSGQKSKHAKATTADTTAATAEPLPTLVDASSSGSLSTIGSPTLVGSALIAALALLALAKTRQSRLRPANASLKLTPPPARLRTATTAPAPTPTVAGLTIGTDITADTTADTTAGLTTGVGTTSAGELRVRDALGVISLEPGLSGGGSGEGRRTGGAVPAPGSRRRRGSHAAGARRRPSKAHPEHPHPAPLRRTAANLHEAVPAPGFEVAANLSEEGFEAFSDPMAPPRRLDSAAFRPAPGTAPFEPTFDTGPLVPISLPPASSSFSAFSPAPRTRATPRSAEASGIGATYRGRRRRPEAPTDPYLPEPTPFWDDLAPRGRRHRRATTATAQTVTVETFVQDAPLRGRRHRTREILTTPDWGRRPA